MEKARITVNIDSEVAERAEAVLNQLGIPMEVAIDMYLRQIIFHQGIPFPVELPQK